PGAPVQPRRRAAGRVGEPDAGRRGGRSRPAARDGGGAAAATRRHGNVTRAGATGGGDRPGRTGELGTGSSGTPSRRRRVRSSGVRSERARHRAPANETLVGPIVPSALGRLSLEIRGSGGQASASAFPGG